MNRNFLRSRGLWAWRVPVWTVLTVVTALSANGTGHRVVAGLGMALSAVILQFIDLARDDRARFGAIIIATVLALAAELAAPSGLAIVAVYIAGSRLPYPLDREPGRSFVVLDTIAVGAVVGWVSHSLVGVLAGLGIPLVAQRALERHALIIERDRAQALLTEVQAGREAEAQAAALQERARIAREMHDVLAHSLAGLSVQLQAVRALAIRDGVGPAVLEPLDRAATLARDGLGEARSVVSTLRDPVGLGLAELPSLVERNPADARLEVTGDAAPVQPDAGHAVYRAVQEALTNAARYAPGSPVEVGVAWQPDALVVRVDDSGPPHGRTAVAGESTGVGLAGMGERVRAVGGSLTAGPKPSGGWRVEVTVPAS